MDDKRSSGKANQRVKFPLFPSLREDIWARRTKATSTAPPRISERADYAAHRSPTASGTAGREKEVNRTKHGKM